MGQQSYRLKKKRGNLSASNFVKPILPATALNRGSEANLFSLAPEPVREWNIMSFCTGMHSSTGTQISYHTRAVELGPGHSVRELPLLNIRLRREQWELFKFAPRFSPTPKKQPRLTLPMFLQSNFH